MEDQRPENPVTEPAPTVDQTNIPQNPQPQDYYVPPQQNYPPPQNPQPPASRVRFAFATGPKEVTFGAFAVICGMMLLNFVFSGGFNLGFVIAMSAYICCAGIYQLAAGGRPTLYSTCLLLLSLAITAGFARSDDEFVKSVMTLFLTVSINLGLCLMARQTLRRAGELSSIKDVFRTIFPMTYGQFAKALRGLNRHMRVKGSWGKRFGATVVGLLILLPVLGLVIPLLKSADAAFTGLIEMLPRFDFWEAFWTVSFGVLVALVLYTRNVALRHRPKDEPVEPRNRRGIYSVTINTVLMGLCVVYLLYMISQLAYFFGGFSGFLPEDFTMAEYARRGFIEMTVLTGVDLAIVILAMFLVRKNNGKAPVLTRLLCLFIGLVTVFMVAAASAKMYMYIGAYGLTRLRLMTELVTVFMGLITLVLMLWLFVPKLPYMKILVVFALLIGAATIWADVDTVVAKYNVEAYQSGKLSHVDVEYLGSLSNGAVPYIAKLTEDANPEVAEAAVEELEELYQWGDLDWNDFRDWNYIKDKAGEYAIDPDAKSENETF